MGGRDGDALVVLTPAGSGKVKRLRHDARVEVRPCGRFGAVADGDVPVEGTAELREQDADVRDARAVIRRTYPVESRLVLGLERAVERLRGRPATPRLAIRITAPDAAYRRPGRPGAPRVMAEARAALGGVPLAPRCRGAVRSAHDRLPGAATRAGDRRARAHSGDRRVRDCPPVP